MSWVWFRACVRSPPSTVSGSSPLAARLALISARNPASEAVSAMADIPRPKVANEATTNTDNHRFPSIHRISARRRYFFRWSAWVAGHSLTERWTSLLPGVTGRDRRTRCPESQIRYRQAEGVACTESALVESNLPSMPGLADAWVAFGHDLAVASQLHSWAEPSRPPP